MKLAAIFLILAGAAVAEEPPAARMLDAKLTIAQRNNSCFGLRGQRDEATLSVMRQALEMTVLRACAATNLRMAGDVDGLVLALQSEQPEARAAAVRELGSFQKPELLKNLAAAAADPNLLVATNAMSGLCAYEDAAVFPYLEAIAQKGGMLAVMALDRIEQLKDPHALPIARQLLIMGDVADRVTAMRVIGDLGDASDLPVLREIAAKKEVVAARQRGFGLMPPIDLSRAATNTIAQIQARTHGS
jgi:HEAT repeat protein